MNRAHSLIGGCLVATTGIAAGGLSGCDTGRRAATLPAFLVDWGDPDPANEATFSSIRDGDDVDTQFVLIGTNGVVQFSTQSVCDNCRVDGSTILIDDIPRVNIRFGRGRDGAGERRPFLVSVDGFYIELVAVGDRFSFQEEDVPFEETDDPSDDLAIPVGAIPNPVRS